MKSLHTKSLYPLDAASITVSAVDHDNVLCVLVDFDSLSISLTPETAEELASALWGAQEAVALERASRRQRSSGHHVEEMF